MDTKTPIVTKTKSNPYPNQNKTPNNKNQNQIGTIRIIETEAYIRTKIETRTSEEPKRNIIMVTKTKTNKAE